VHLALEVVREDRRGLLGAAVLLVKEQRCGRSELALRSAGTLRPAEQPEADPQRQAIAERQRAKLVVFGDVQDRAVLSIRWVGDVAGQRDVHDGFLRKEGAEVRKRDVDVCKERTDERGWRGERMPDGGAEDR
jgi:hypothetical protein